MFWDCSNNWLLFLNNKHFFTNAQIEINLGTWKVSFWQTICLYGLILTRTNTVVQIKLHNVIENGNFRASLVLFMEQLSNCGRFKFIINDIIRLVVILSYYIRSKQSTKKLQYTYLMFTPSAFQFCLRRRQKWPTQVINGLWEAVVRRRVLTSLCLYLSHLHSCYKILRWLCFLSSHNMLVISQACSIMSL